MRPMPHPTNARGSRTSPRRRIPSDRSDASAIPIGRSRSTSSHMVEGGPIDRGSKVANRHRRAGTTPGRRSVRRSSNRRDPGMRRRAALLRGGIAPTHRAAPRAEPRTSDRMRRGRPSSRRRRRTGPSRPARRPVHRRAAVCARRRWRAPPVHAGRRVPAHCRPVRSSTRPCTRRARRSAPSRAPRRRGSRPRAAARGSTI